MVVRVRETARDQRCLEYLRRLALRHGADVAGGFRPDGSVWFDALTHLDGTSLRQIKISASPSSQLPAMGTYAFADGGSVWTIVLDGTTPEELDCPSRGDCRG